MTYLVLTSAPARAQAPPSKFENFTATTTNLAVGNGEALRINVLAWTPPPEREKIVAAFLEKGEPALLEAAKSAPSAGYIWTTESLGYTLKYAHKTSLPNGTERIVLVTDRPLGEWSRAAWKAAGGAAAAGPVTLVEIRLSKQGRGEGKMSLAGKIGVDQTEKTFQLENYESAPVSLKDVRRAEVR
jgi:hypothetical protein